MRTIFTFISVIFLQLNFLKAQQPEPVYGIAKQFQTIEWYAKQAKLWKTETEKDTTNAKAWEYYYRANRNISACGDRTQSLLPGMTDSLQGIIKKMEHAIPETFEYNLMLYYNESFRGDREKYFPNLLKAYSIDPTRAEIYPDMIVYAETKGDKIHKKEYLSKWYNTNQMSPGILNWNYNLLMSVAENGVLITNGDNDTYPSWMLQDVKNFRTDVKIINLSLFLLDDYRKALCAELGIPFLEIDYNKISTPEELNKLIGEFLIINITKRPLYFAESCDPLYYKTFEDSMYIEGLAFRFSAKKYDNITLLQKNIEENFLIDYLYFDFSNDISKEIVYNCNTNYIAPFISLYDYYSSLKKTDKADKYKNMILSIAEKAKMKSEVEQYFKERK